MDNQPCSLGVIETEGLTAAIEAADAILKSSSVKLIGLHFVGSGLVAVLVTGDTGSVQAAMQAGGSAAERKGKVLGKKVIPRCNQQLINYLKALTSSASPPPLTLAPTRPVHRRGGH